MKKVFALNLSKEIVETAKKLAEKEMRSFSNLVEWVLKDYIDKHGDDNK